MNELTRLRPRAPSKRNKHTQKLREPYRPRVPLLERKQDKVKS